MLVVKNKINIFKCNGFYQIEFLVVEVHFNFKIRICSKEMMFLLIYYTSVCITTDTTC